QRRVEHVDQARQLRAQVVVDELLVVTWALAVPVVLPAQRCQNLVDEWVAESRDLYLVTERFQLTVRREDPEVRPACARPDADRRARLDEGRDRDLDRDR